MIGVLWAYEGWQYVTFSAGEAIDPQRTFPRAIVIGTASLVGIYLLANAAIWRRSAWTASRARIASPPKPSAPSSVPARRS